MPLSNKYRAKDLGTLSVYLHINREFVITAPMDFHVLIDIAFVT